MDEIFQTKYTMDEFQLPTPHQAKVMRTDATRAIPTFIPEIQEESTMAINEAFLPTTGKGTFNL